MHLLNTSTITLSEVKSEKPPAYAILSHQWGDSEVSFQDMQDGKAIQRVTRCCAQAAEDGWQYVWIDSCCIDKKSSAELSEAINSMFQWYRSAQVCYAYLGDVDNTRAFHDSKWFTRGWTLQELLAPETMVFFAQDWVEIGTKFSLAPLISSITGIHNLFSFESACVAQKMSWAAKRETTRVEDRAYCLMGLFKVNMPLLYGEGERAFMRLQLEILRKTDDESIFAWAKQEDLVFRTFNFSEYSGLLASSPTEFELSRNVQRSTFDVGSPPYSMTNKGLSIEPLLVHSKFGDSITMTSGHWPVPSEDLDMGLHTEFGVMLYVQSGRRCNITKHR
jgi:Heterokaryon incompatibility protein (HET)